MEVSQIKNKLQNGFRKYKFSVIVLLIGLVLMAIPGRTSDKRDAAATDSIEINTPNLEDRLSTVLSLVSGAGKVEVVLTTAAGEEVVYQTNEDSSIGASTTHDKKNTVTVTDANRNQTGLIRQVNPARYMGAIVLCQGADDPSVCLAIVDAVSKATGLGANKISVLKME